MTDQAAPAPAPEPTSEPKASLWQRALAASLPYLVQAVGAVIVAALGMAAGIYAQTYRQAVAPAPKPEYVTTGSIADIQPQLLRIEDKADRILKEGPQWRDPQPTLRAAPPAAKPRARVQKDSGWLASLLGPNSKP